MKGQQIIFHDISGVNPNVCTFHSMSRLESTQSKINNCCVFFLYIFLFRHRLFGPRSNIQQSDLIVWPETRREARVYKTYMTISLMIVEMVKHFVNHTHIVCQWSMIREIVTTSVALCARCCVIISLWSDAKLVIGDSREATFYNVLSLKKNRKRTIYLAWLERE